VGAARRQTRSQARRHVELVADQEHVARGDVGDTVRCDVDARQHLAARRVDPRDDRRLTEADVQLVRRARLHREGRVSVERHLVHHRAGVTVDAREHAVAEQRVEQSALRGRVDEETGGCHCEVDVPRIRPESLDGQRPLLSCAGDQDGLVEIAGDAAARRVIAARVIRLAAGSVAVVRRRQPAPGHGQCKLDAHDPVGEGTLHGAPSCNAPASPP
jgi:hypothetical protein